MRIQKLLLFIYGAIPITLFEFITYAKDNKTDKQVLDLLAYRNSTHKKIAHKVNNYTNLKSYH